MVESAALELRNALAGCTSPYLQQHSGNPVAWQSWGEPAFQLARTLDRPIFLSIGYSTCHWCHVMERESFEDELTAQFLNAHFLSIKVDREEHPEVDRLFMTFVQATTGSGGWPLNVFLTPGLEPFYGGTYYPPRDMWRRPGFMSVLQSVQRAWEADRTQVVQGGHNMIEALRQYARPASPQQAPETAAVLQGAYHHLSQSWDRQWGGFGEAPKFPRPAAHLFLHRYQSLFQDTTALEMSLQTLKQMATGGMYDHLAGGFHRYSTDRFWHVPHFEKMLYDQAQLLDAYREAWLITRDPAHLEVLRGIVGFVRQEMTHPDGGFYAALDADSLPASGGTEAREGAYYTWSADEFATVLGADAGQAAAWLGVRPEGNVAVSADPQGEFAGLNILTTAPGGSAGLSQAEQDSIRQRLAAHRRQRPYPHRDEKIIAGWNGLMIGALARAGLATGEPSMVDLATAAATFVREQLYAATVPQPLARHFCRMPSQVKGTALDYAALAHGLLSLYMATGRKDWLRWATELMQQFERLFGDTDAAGYFEAPQSADLALRFMDASDGAEPSANALAISNFHQLGAMLPDDALAQRARSLEQFWLGVGAGAPWTMNRLLGAVADGLLPPCQVLLAVPAEAHQSAWHLAVGAASQFCPQLILRWEAAAPGNQQASATVCTANGCGLPTSDLEILKNSITQSATTEQGL